MPNERPNESYDPLLAALADIANDLEFEIGITVNVGGSIINGLLVGWKRYWRAVEERVASASTNNPEARDSFVRSWREIRIQWEAEDLGKGVEDQEDEPSPYHIHLINARMLIGIHMEEINPWRGRIGQIDGWYIGDGSPHQP